MYTGEGAIPPVYRREGDQSRIQEEWRSVPYTGKGAIPHVYRRKGHHRHIWGRSNPTRIQERKDTQGIVLVTFDKAKSVKPFVWNRSKRKE